MSLHWEDPLIGNLGKQSVQEGELTPGSISGCDIRTDPGDILPPAPIQRAYVAGHLGDPGAVLAGPAGAGGPPGTLAAAIYGWSTRS